MTAATIVNTGTERLLDLGAAKDRGEEGSKFSLCIHPSSNAMPNVCHLELLCPGHLRGVTTSLGNRFCIGFCAQTCASPITECFHQTNEGTLTKMQEQRGQPSGAVGRMDLKPPTVGGTTTV